MSQDLEVLNENTIRITVERMNPGNYTLIVELCHTGCDDGWENWETFEHPMVALMPARFELEPEDARLPAFYEQQTIVLGAGDMWTFGPDQLPRVEILDLNDGRRVVRELAPRYIDAATAEVDLVPGLRSGRYLLKASMESPYDPSYVVEHHIDVGLKLEWPVLGDVPKQTLIAEASGVTFTNPPVVKLQWGDEPDEVQTARDVQVVGASQVRFTIDGTLPPYAQAKISVILDGYVIEHWEQTHWASGRMITVSDRRGQPVPYVDVEVCFSPDCGSSEWFVVVNGRFQSDLDPGDYIIKTWWKDGVARPTYIPFTVTDALYYYFLSEPDPNVTITVVDGEAGAVPGAQACISAAREGGWLDGRYACVTTDENGAASFYLPSGEYVLSEVSVGSYAQPVGREFFPGTEASPRKVEVVLLRPNVSGTVGLDSLPLGDDEAPSSVGVGIRRSDGERRFFAADEQGRFLTRLDPGDYVLDLVYVYVWNSQSYTVRAYTYYLGEQYTVRVESDVEPVDEIEVGLPAPNVAGKVIIAGQDTQESGWVSIGAAGGSVQFDAQFSVGQWYLHAPDGQYAVNGVNVYVSDDWSSWIGYESNVLFEVAGGKADPVTVKPAPAKVHAGIPLDGHEVALPAYGIQLGASPELQVTRGGQVLDGVQATVVGRTEGWLQISLSGNLDAGGYEIAVTDDSYRWDLVAIPAEPARVKLAGSTSAYVGVPVPVQVTITRELGMPVAVDSDTTVELTATSGSFFADAAGKDRITQFTLPGGQHTAQVYYVGSVAGTFTLTARVDGLDSATLTVTLQKQGGGGGGGGGGKPVVPVTPEEPAPTPEPGETDEPETGEPKTGASAETGEASGGDQTVETDQGTLTEAVLPDGTTSVSLQIDPEKVEAALTEGDLVVDLAAANAAVSTVTLPVDLLDALQASGSSLVIRTGVADLMIPAEVIASTASAGAGAQLQVTVSAVAAPSTASVRNQGITPAGAAVQLEMALVGADGTQQGVTRFDQPVTLTLPYAETADPQFLGIYRFDPESGTWTYVGGRVDEEQGVIATALWHFSEYAVMAYTRTFPDVPADHWAFTDIQVLAARHVVRGDEAGRFNPAGTVTRAEFAALMVRTLGLERVTPVQPSFTDVAASDWFYADAETAAAAGLIQGSAGAFRPQDPISRQEMAAILARALQLRDGATGAALTPAEVEALIAPLADRSAIASWAEADAALMLHLGLMKGRTAETFAPLETATRAEAVVVLKRLLVQLGEL